MASCHVKTKKGLSLFYHWPVPLSQLRVYVFTELRVYMFRTDMLCQRGQTSKKMDTFWWHPLLVLVCVSQFLICLRNRARILGPGWTRHEVAAPGWQGRVNPGLQPSVWSNPEPKHGLYSYYIPTIFDYLQLIPPVKNTLVLSSACFWVVVLWLWNWLCYKCLCKKSIHVIVSHAHYYMYFALNHKTYR